MAKILAEVILQVHATPRVLRRRFCMNEGLSDDSSLPTRVHYREAGTIRAMVRRLQLS